MSNLELTGFIWGYLDSSVSPLLCGFIADRWGILSAFYFLAGTVFVAILIVMVIREEGKESPALVEEPA